MDIELQEIRDFIAGLPPFDRLPEQSLEQLTRAITIRYLRRGKHIPENNEAVTELYILRQGAVSLYSKNDNLVGIVSERDILQAVDRLVSVYVSLENARAWKGEHNWVDGIMTRKVITVGEDDALAKVCEVMSAHHIHRVPVVRGRRVVGIISSMDILRLFYKTEGRL